MEISTFPIVKISVSILLLLFLGVPFGGPFTLLEIQRLGIKKEVRERMIRGINKGELTLLGFSKSESRSKLNWKESNEFEFDGEMYDVVDSKETGDSVWYWCWYDRDETALNKQLNTLVAQTIRHSPFHREQTKQITSFLQTLISHHRFNWKTFGSSGTVFRSADQVNYSSLMISPPVPPP